MTFSKSEFAQTIPDIFKRCPGDTVYRQTAVFVEILVFNRYSGLLYVDGELVKLYGCPVLIREDVIEKVAVSVEYFGGDGGRVAG